MNDEKFKNAYKNLNTEQRRAVDAIEGPVMVIAGPGTGKTTILTLRIANILQKTDTPPSGILALTFTEAGVKAMRKKLREIIGSRAEEVRIHTFHGFARSIISEYDDHFPEIARNTQITDIEKEEIIRTILRTPLFKKLRPLGEPDFYIQKILSGIQTAKQEAWTPDMLIDYAQSEIKRIENDESSRSTRGKTKGELKGEALKRIEKCERTILFGNVYKLYETRKKEEKLLDFDDLIYELLTALHNDNLLLRLLQESFLYVLVDEHQDTNNTQNLIVRHLADFFEAPNLFVVGDEKQAIYRFQGASVKNFLDFKETWKTMETITLASNYRSHQDILDAAFKLIEHNYTDEEHKDLRVELASYASHAKKPIDIHIANDAETEEALIIETLKKILNESNDDIALITRSNADVVRLLSLCESADIDATAERGIDIFSHPLGQAFFSLSKFLHDPSQIEALAETIASGMWNLPFEKRVEYLRLIRKSEATEVLKNIPIFDQLTRLKNEQTPLQFISSIADLSGFQDVAAQTILGTEIWRGLWNLAQEITSTGINDPNILLNRLLAYQTSAEKKTIKIKTGGIKSRITILTAHSSKGLEFDRVLIPFATEESWVHKRRSSYFVFPQEKEEEDNLRDERRLFYVAMTRARKHLYITLSSEDREGNPLSPVRFIEEMGSEHVKASEVAHQSLPHKKEKPHDHQKREETQAIEYTKRVLIEKGLSVTALNHFLNCPQKFYKSSILKIPEAPTPSSERGSAMHEAIARVWNTRDGSRIMNYELCRKTIEEVATNYISHSLLPKFEKEIIFEEIKEQAPLIAKSLANHFNEEGVVKVEKWVETSYKTVHSEIILHGKLDTTIERGNKILVFDYKTGEAMSENEIRGKTKNSTGDYFRQLVFYRLLLESQGSIKKEILPSLVFIKPDSKGECRVIQLPIEQTDIDQIKSDIDSVVEAVWSGNLLSMKCEKEDCRYCAD